MPLQLGFLTKAYLDTSKEVDQRWGFEVMPYVGFAWNLRAMIYTSDMNVRDNRLNVARRLT